MHKYFISPFVPPADPKIVFEKYRVNGEFQVKGKRGVTLLSLLLSLVLKMIVFFIVFHLSVAVC